MLQTEISRQATVATVLEGIRQDAILGKFSGEKQISETEIAQQYQVSRSSVRSAFQILERDGLITVQPNGRKLLKKVDVKYIEDLCLTRSILECEAVKLIISKESCDFTKLLQLVGQFYVFQNQPQGKDRRTELALINEDFHSELFVMTDNIPLLQCHRTISPMLQTIVELNATMEPEQNEHGYYESHKKILEMLMEKNEDVIEYIRYHAMNATKNDIMLAIERAGLEKMEEQASEK